MVIMAKCGLKKQSLCLIARGGETRYNKKQCTALFFCFTAKQPACAPRCGHVAEQAPAPRACRQERYRQMERYGPVANRQCSELCPYVARVKVFAWQNGLAWDAALEELERRAARLCPGGALAHSAQPAVCEQQGALPEECRIWRLLLCVSGACGMTVYKYMKSAHAAALFDMPQAGEEPRQQRVPAVQTPLGSEAAQEQKSSAAACSGQAAAASQTEAAAPPQEKKGPEQFFSRLHSSGTAWVHGAAGKVRAGWAHAREGLRPPRLEGRARQFAFAFGITSAVIALFAAVGLSYWLGYRASVRENGTYEDGYAAAVSEKGTYESGYAAALEENGSYEEGYDRGYAEGRAEGYEAGRTEGYEEGLKDGMAEPGQPPAASGSGAAAEQQAVWVSRYLGRRYHSTPDCSRVIDPVQITLEEAEREGYSRCSRCCGEE